MNPLTKLMMLGVAFLALPASTWADHRSADEYAEALAAADRMEGDADRDAARKPAEVLAFVGVDPGMTVLDVMAAGGWYSEVFAIAVGPEGKVIIENPFWLLEARDNASDKALTERLWKERLPNAERADNGLEEGNIAAGSVDVAFTALNFHDTYYMVSPEAAVTQMEQIHATLKAGGVLVVIDHRGDPDQDNAKLHRIDESIVRDIAESTGFTLVAEGDMLTNPDDPRTGMPFMPDIRGKTDRFVLKFEK